MPPIAGLPHQSPYYSAAPKHPIEKPAGRLHIAGRVDRSEIFLSAPHRSVEKATIIGYFRWRYAEARLARSQTKVLKSGPSGRKSAATPARKVATKRPMRQGDVDKLVLGTTNAPYRTAVSADELAKRLASGRGGPWKVHVATFFTDVRPELILRFAEVHGISPRTLASSYRAIKASTGEANPALETAFEQLAPSA